MTRPPLTALVLPGGGARAAYQAGVLAAIAEMLPAPTENPFHILCGTSAGAINAATLACKAENFRAAVEDLHEVWRDMHAHQVYRADPLGIAVTGGRWLAALAFGWLVRHSPRALLDNAPLRGLLDARLDFSGVDRAIAAGKLHAVSITASGYTTGHSVSFFQGRASIVPWSRINRFGSRDRIGLDHLMASAAIPFLFPAVRLHREWFGDGSMRQLAPLSPAIHLGAEKVLVIGAGRMGERVTRQGGGDYPTLAQIAGHALSSIFLDGLSADIERMQRINHTVGAIPDVVRAEQGVALRPVETLVIAPSQRLDDLAIRHAQALPRAVRMLMRGIGAMRRGGGALTSYLLFEQRYTRALIDLGHDDALARRDALKAFLEI